MIKGTAVFVYILPQNYYTRRDVICKQNVDYVAVFDKMQEILIYPYLVI